MLQSSSELQLVGSKQSVSRYALSAYITEAWRSDPPELALLSRLTQHAFADGLTYSGPCRP